MALWDPGSTVPSMGHHSRGAYVGLIARIVEDGRSGVLEVRSGQRFRRLYFVAGAPVWFESDRPQDTLDDDAMADPDQRLKLLKRGMGVPLQWRKGGWTFEPREALPAEVLQKMAFLDCAPLAPLWSGVQSTLRADELLEAVTAPDAGPIQPLKGLGDRFDRLEVGGQLAYLPGALDQPRSLNDLMKAHAADYEDLLKLLWMMEAMGWVRRDGDRAVALGFASPEEDPFGVSQPPLDPVEAPPPEQEEEPPEDEPAPTKGIGRYVHASTPGTRREDLRPADQEEPAIDKLVVSDPERATTRPDESLPRARRVRDTRSVPRRSMPASLSADAVRRDYETRMGTDYYTFLGVPAKAGQAVIDRAWTKLLKRWTVASKNPTLPKEVRQQARELGQVAHLAGRMFSEPTRRMEYDRRLERGQAPRAGGMKAARGLSKTNPRASVPHRPPAGDPLREARYVLERGDYSKAVAMLKHLRVQRPSDAGVLADLGWAVWKASAETEREQAEEYLQIATTFAARDARAREFLARIALDAGDVEAARGRLELLLQITPDAAWAKKALAALPAPGEQSASSALRIKKLWGR